MMIGYGLVNSLSQLAIRPLADKMSQKGRREDMLLQMEEKHRLDLDMLRLNKEIDLANNFNIQQYSHALRIKEAQGQFEKQLEMWQLGQFNQTMWPLLTPFDHPSLKPHGTKNGQVPVNFFMAKTDPRSPYASLMQSDVKNQLSTFLQTSYSASTDHPCICRIGDWKDGFQDAAFINALWYGLQGQPCIVINPIQSEFGERLDLNVSLWGLAQDGFSPLTQSVLTGPFGSAIGKIKRDETIKWKDMGLPASSPEMTHNFSLLAQEKSLREQGRDENVIRQLLIQYKLPKEIQTTVLNRFTSDYSHTLACISGMYSDIIHLIEYGAEPYMPTAINAYSHLVGRNITIPDVAVEYYRKALCNITCSDYLQGHLPYAYLKVAKSIQFDTLNAHQVFQEGIGLWANRKQDLQKELPLPDTIDGCVRLLRDISTDTDKPYLELAQKVLISINEQDAAKELDEKIVYIAASETTDPESEKEVTWDILETAHYSQREFERWANRNSPQALRLGASAAALQVRQSCLCMAFLDAEANIIHHEKSLHGMCVSARTFVVDNEMPPDGMLIYDLDKHYYKTNTVFMEKNNLFESVGKKLDEFFANSPRIVIVPREQHPRQDDVVQLLMSRAGQDVEVHSIDSSFEYNDLIRWVEKNAIGDTFYVAKSTSNENRKALCVFFGKNDTVLSGVQYPKVCLFYSKLHPSIADLFADGNSIYVQSFKIVEE